MADPASAFPNYLQNSYNLTNQVRNSGGMWNWNDSWQNFMVNYALSEYEFDRNKEMWNLMNEYNTPQAQMQRFKEAGLNPMLIYQQGTPGNATSPAQYQKPNIQFTPGKDTNARLSAAMDVIGVVTNLAQSIGGMIDQGLNLQLKENQVYESNFDRYMLQHTFGSPGATGINMINLDETLNPLSSKFDPMAYLAFQRKGQLPQFINTYLSADVSRELQKFESDYQDYYNKNLLPKFNEFQQGKIDLQGIERVISEYERDAMTMIPAPLRGILEPVLQWIAPFIKFIVKRSTSSESSGSYCTLPPRSRTSNLPRTKSSYN